MSVNKSEMPVKFDGYYAEGFPDGDIKVVSIDSQFTNKDTLPTEMAIRQRYTPTYILSK